MVFRISEEADGRLRMVAKRLSGKGGYDPGKLKDQKDRWLTPDERVRFQEALRSVEFVLVAPVECTGVLDGEVLVLEQNQDRHYAIGQRFWEMRQPMAKMSALLSEFAGWGRHQTP